LEPLHHERDILNQELELLLEKQTEKVLSQGPTIIGDKKPKKSISEINSRLFEAAASLEVLRENLTSESNLFLKTFDELLSNFLTPRQQAKFILYIEHAVTSIHQLKAIWDLYNNQELPM